MTDTSRWDAVVIGAGAGGGALAYQLCQHGWRVLVLEKGPRHQPADYRHDELTMIHRHFFTPDPAYDPHIVVTRKTTAGVRHKMGWTASCVGGGTEHMGAYLYRFHPHDFRVRSEYGDYQEVADWPFDYAELEPYYTATEQMLGVAGDAAAMADYVPRSQPLPLPPVRTHPIATALEQACREHTLRSSPTPRAVNSQPYGGRPACSYCDHCGGFGCPIEARATSRNTFIAAAERSGRCEVRHGCMVTRLLLADDTPTTHARLAGCVFRDAHGEEHRVDANVVALACSAVESARLLLMSRDDRFPNGLANRNGRVGRHLQFHGVTMGWAEYTAADHAAWQQPAHSAFIGRSVYDCYQLPASVAPLRRGGIIRFSAVSHQPIGDAQTLSTTDGELAWGQRLLHRLNGYYQQVRRIGYEVFHDFIPNAETYVTLDPSVSDPWQRPSARIHLHVDPHQKAAGEWLAQRAEQVLQTLKPKRIQRAVTGGTTWHLMHGTCRASDDPKSGVVDRYCRSHDIDNLFVVDASFMPTAGIAPPTLTIMANALRVGDHIARHV